MSWFRGFDSQAITEEQKVKVAEYVKICSNESGVTPEELATAKAKPEAIDTKNVKHQVCLRWATVFQRSQNIENNFHFSIFTQKFAKCFFEKAGFIDAATGNFNEKVTIEKLSAGETDKTKVEQLVKLCQKDLGTDKNEIPLKLYKCYLQNKAF